jgi:hypothetical protein
VSNRQKMTNLQKRRRLDALYERGSEIRFGDGGLKSEGAAEAPDDIVLWITPPSALQREQAVREAQAARARQLLMLKRDPDSIPGAVTDQYIEEMELDMLIEYLSDMNDAEIQSEATRNVMAKEEWEDMDALRDSIRQWEEAGKPDPEVAPEWKDLLDRDYEFGEQIQLEAIQIAAHSKESMKLLPMERLREMAKDRRVEILGNETFMNSYQNHLMFFSCRDGDDHRELFFEDVEDMRSAADEVQEAIIGVFASFITEAGEAKNSPRVEDGSEQSPPPEKQETSESSTQEA